MLMSLSACPQMLFYVDIVENYGRDPEIKKIGGQNRELYFVPCLNPLMDMRTMSFKAHLVEAIGGRM